MCEAAFAKVIPGPICGAQVGTGWPAPRGAGKREEAENTPFPSPQPLAQALLGPENKTQSSVPRRQGNRFPEAGERSSAERSPTQEVLLASACCPGL